MTFNDLKLFVSQTMSMKEVYQPVAIKHVLGQVNGQSSLSRINDTIRNQGPEYRSRTESQTKQRPCQVLVDHGVLETPDGGVTYRLVGFNALSEDQKRDLSELCESRLRAYLGSVTQAVPRPTPPPEPSAPDAVSWESSSVEDLRFGSQDCDLFTKYPRSAPWNPLPDTDKTSFKWIRARLADICDRAAARANRLTNVQLRHFASHSTLR